MVMWFGICMSQAFAGRHYIPYHLLKRFDFGKPAIIFPVKNFFSVNTDVKITVHFTGLKGNRLQVAFKSGKKFLGHISGTQQPVAFGAVFNGNGWFHMLIVVAIKVRPNFESNAAD